jgi:hypothetical protein
VTRPRVQVALHGPQMDIYRWFDEICRPTPDCCITRSLRFAASYPAKEMTNALEFKSFVDLHDTQLTLTTEP